MTNRNKMIGIIATRALALAVVTCVAFGLIVSAQVEITPTTATSSNLYVEWDTDDPERIEVIKWNREGLNGSEDNLTNTGEFGAGPCFDGLVEYFGNSWAPPDPNAGGKVFVGAGTTGVRTRGPDSKVVINSISEDCPPTSAGVAVNTLYKFWQGGQAANKMRVTRTFSFEEPYNYDFRPFIPRLHPIGSFSQVLHPDALGTTLLTRQVGGSVCPLGCTVTDWNGTNEATSWYAIHDPVSSRGVVVRHRPSEFASALWLDWDGASETNSSSVLLLAPAGGFTGEIVEVQTLCFYDSGNWIPSLTPPLGC